MLSKCERGKSAHGLDRGTQLAHLGDDLVDRGFQGLPGKLALVLGFPRQSLSQLIKVINTIHSVPGFLFLAERDGVVCQEATGRWG